MLALLVGGVIGLVLGLTGAGGSVFAVPLLTLVLGLPIDHAIGISLGAVGFSAALGVLARLRLKEIAWIPAVVISICGAMTAPLGRTIGTWTNDVFLLLAFSLLAFYIATNIWRQASRLPGTVARASLDSDSNVNSTMQANESVGLSSNMYSLAVIGVLAGLLSGFFGVGGGFFVVPILLAVTGVPMRVAVGTSLVIITCMSSSGFATYLSLEADLPLTVFALTAAGGAIGMLAGTQLTRKINGPVLQKIFAVSITLISSITVYHTIGTGFSL